MTVVEFINCAQLSESTDGVQSFLYLKDWHFVKVLSLDCNQMLYANYSNRELAWTVKLGQLTF